MKTLIILAIVTMSACEGGLALNRDIDDTRLGTDPNSPNIDGQPGDGSDQNPNPTFQTALELRPYSRLTKSEYRLVVEDLLVGSDPNSAAQIYGTISLFNENNYKGFYKNYDPVSVSPGIESQYLSFAVQLADAFVGSQTFQSLCIDDCVQGLVDELLPRIWRRVPSEDEVRNLKAFYLATPAELRERALLTRVFASPFFHYKIYETDQDDTFRKMVLVSELVAGSFPDEEMFQAWQLGDLEGQWAFHIERLLDAHPERFSTLFVTQWLGLGSLAESDAQIDATPLRTVMSEPAMIFAELLRTEAGIEGMVSLDYNMVTPGLARVYGLDGAQFESGFQRADITETIFGTAALTYLTVDLETQNPNPIKRGSYVVNHLLCKNLLFPSSEVQSEVDRIVNDAPDDLSPPERMAYFREFSACSGCHNQFDFHGLALEEIGAFGTDRDLYYTGDPVVSEGRVDDISFQSSVEYVEQLSRTDDLNTCFASQVFAYATSSHHVTTFSKMREIEDSLTDLTAKEIVIRMLLQAIGETR